MNDSLVIKMFPYYFHVTMATTIILSVKYFMYNFYTSSLKKGGVAACMYF